MKTQIFSIVAAASAMCCGATASLGQERGPASEIDGELVDVGEELGVLQDPAFDTYVSLEFLRDAWTSLDPAALADAGLQLAEGERVLSRSHKVVTAQTMLRLAVKVAVERRDKHTLARLAQAAEALERKQLAQVIATAQKLASQPRAVAPPIEIDLNDVTSKDVEFYQVIKQQIENAGLRGDRAALAQVAMVVKGSALPGSMEKHLARQIADAKTKLPTEVSTDTKALKKLASASRYSFIGTNQPIAGNKFIEVYFHIHNSSSRTVIARVTGYFDTPGGIFSSPSIGWSSSAFSTIRPRETKAIRLPHLMTFGPRWFENAAVVEVNGVPLGHQYGTRAVGGAVGHFIDSPTIWYISDTSLKAGQVFKK